MFTPGSVDTSVKMMMPYARALRLHRERAEARLPIQLLLLILPRFGAVTVTILDAAVGANACPRTP